jgi:hypothetical protein
MAFHLSQVAVHTSCVSIDATAADNSSPAANMAAALPAADPDDSGPQYAYGSQLVGSCEIDCYLFSCLPTPRQELNFDESDII